MYLHPSRLVLQWGCAAASGATLSIGRRTDALKQGWVGFKREWGIPQQHAHHLSLVHLLVGQTLTCTKVKMYQHLATHTQW